MIAKMKPAIPFDLGCSSCNAQRPAKVPADQFEEVSGGILVTTEGDGISLCADAHEGSIWLELENAQAVYKTLRRALKHLQESK